MVRDNLFLIDVTFLLAASETTFLGASLLIDEMGRDHTQTFGVVRDMLRLRKLLGIQNAAVLVGEESLAATTKPVLDDLMQFLTQIGVTIIRQDTVRVIDICGQLGASARWIVSTNSSIQQLVTDHLGVLVPRVGEETEVITMKSLAKIGICPNLVPAMLALSDGKDAPLKRQQAVRLLEIYGSLNDALADVSSAPSADWKRKLLPKKDGLLEKEESLRVLPTMMLPTLANKLSGGFIENTKRNAEALNAFGFSSLVRLLPSPNAVSFDAATSNASELDYRAIRNPSDLRVLEECLSVATVCSIDTETSGKDPRSAVLYGVSFAVKEGQAFFVPTMKSDLDGLTPEEVCTRLNKVLTRRLKLVGHNLKYDFAVLHRNGINVQTLHFDTMLAAYECFGDWEFWNLSAVAKKLLGATIKRYRDIVNKDETFLDRSFKELVDHACSDADIALRLYTVLERELRKRQIEKHFFDGAMRIERLLLLRERDGVRVDIKRMIKLGEAIRTNADRLKAAAIADVGFAFDIDSTKATTEVLRKLGIWEKTTRPLGEAQMEQIAGDFPIIKNIIRYRRERNRCREIEAVCAKAENCRVFASFSQIKNIYGGLHVGSPNLDEAIKEGAVLDKGIVGLFGGDMAMALQALVEASNDAILRKDIKHSSGIGFIPGTSIVEDYDHGHIFLHIAAGASDPVICRRFLIAKAQLLSLKSMITSRYRTLFLWLEDFRRASIARGFAEYHGKRKYLAGLQSSDIDRRNKAIRYAIRWLVNY